MEIVSAISPAFLDQCQADGIPVFLIPNRDYWVPISQAGKFLGAGWSIETINRMIERGELVEGEHWRDERSLNSQRSNKKINVYAVDKWLSER